MNINHLISILADENAGSMNSTLFMGYLVLAIGSLVGIATPIITLIMNKHKYSKDDDSNRRKEITDLQQAITNSNKELMEVIIQKNEAQTKELNNTNIQLRDSINQSNNQLRDTISEFNASNIKSQAQLSANLTTLNNTIDALNSRMGTIEDEEKNIKRLLAKDKERLDLHELKLKSHGKRLNNLDHMDDDTDYDA